MLITGFPKFIQKHSCGSECGVEGGIKISKPPVSRLSPKLQYRIDGIAIQFFLRGNNSSEAFSPFRLVISQLSSSNISYHLVFDATINFSFLQNVG